MTIFRRRRAASMKYLKSDDDHRQHLNASSTDYHHPQKPIQIEHPHLLSSSTIIPSLPSNHRVNTLSGIHDGLSDRESLIQQLGHSYATSTNLDDFYEEIKEQHQQPIHLDLGTNPYLEPKSFDDRRKLFEDHRLSQPIRDHNEVFYYEYDS